MSEVCQSGRCSTQTTRRHETVGNVAGIPLTDRLLDDAEPTSRDEAPQIKKRLLPDASELFQQVPPTLNAVETHTSAVPASCSMHLCALRLLCVREPELSSSEVSMHHLNLLFQCTNGFVQIDRPSFLNPEANKRNKVCAAHLGRQPAEAAAQQQLQQQAEARAREADISKMAPKLKGQPDTQAVLSAPAQRRSEPVGEKKPALIGNDALVRLHPACDVFEDCCCQQLRCQQVDSCTTVYLYGTCR